jgi:glutaredoxin
VTEKVRVILYTKPGCHLCDEMKREIQRAGCAQLYTLDEVNIETDSDLLARYRYEIPVLLIDGVEAFRHRLRAEDFKARLSGQQS